MTHSWPCLRLTSPKFLDRFGIPFHITAFVNYRAFGLEEFYPSFGANSLQVKLLTPKPVLPLNLGLRVLQWSQK